MISLVILLIHFSSLIILTFKLSSLHSFTGPIFESAQFLNATLFTLKQAVLSSVASIFLGLIAAPGYARLHRFQKLTRFVLLLPTLLSPVLSSLALLLTLRTYPYGLLGIIIAHAFLNVGLCTVWLGQSWQTYEEKWEPIRTVLGIPLLTFWRKVFIPQIWPQVLNTFVVVFSFCISSFAIPLVFGGGPQNSTLEVLLYERLKVDGDISAALWISLTQALIQILIFAVLLTRHFQNPFQPKKLLINTSFSKRTVFPLIYAILTLVPLFQIFRVGLPQFLNFDLIFRPVLISLLLFAAVTAITLVGLALLSSLKIKNYLTRAPALSGVVVGLSCLILTHSLNLHSFSKYILLLIYGHLCVTFIPVLRLAEPALSQTRLKFRKVMAQIGANDLLALRKIYWPLNKKILISGALLSGIWSMGEFSVSKTVSGEYATLPVAVENLMGSYRLEMAAELSLILVLITLFSLTVVEVIAHVMD